MANSKQAQTKRQNMMQRAETQRTAHFPDVPTNLLWHRKTSDGFITIPRTLPIAMEVIDALSKSQPAGHTYFGLWCRSPDHPLVTIENPAIFAAEVGFSGERAVDTWRRRMKTLREAGFIRTKKGPAGDFHYVLLINPNIVIEHLHSQGKVRNYTYSKFHDRMLEIGAFAEIESARAMLVPVPPPPPSAPPSP